MKILSSVLLMTLATSAFAISECKIERSYSNFYVTIDGAYMTNASSTIDEAMKEAYDLHKIGMCSLPTPKGECKVERSYSNYYVTINASYFTSASSTLSEVQRDLNKLVNHRLCYSPRARVACKIERSYSNFYVTAGGSYLTSAFPTIQGAHETIPALQRLGLCYSNYSPSPMPAPQSPSENQTSYEDVLGFNFKMRSFQISNTVVAVAKAIEPFINNAQENQVDAIKAKAINLRAQINARSELGLVKKTITELSNLIHEASPFIEQALETDTLDGMAEDFITARESIDRMNRFLAREYQGRGMDLY